MSGFGTGTDLDYLVEMGFHRDEARTALASAKGGRLAAQMVLQGVMSAEEASAWQAEVDGDFASGVSDKRMPAASATRALWKSPIYCRVASARTDHDTSAGGKVVTLYTIRAITKFGREFAVERRYSEIYAYKRNLPLGTCSHFSNFFPLPGVRSPTGAAAIEKRRLRLEEWLRELCLDERIMTSRVLLFQLYAFLGYQVREHAPHSPPASSRPCQYCTKH